MLWFLALWFSCGWSYISRVSPVTLDPLCTVGTTRECGSSANTPLESLTLSTQCSSDGCPMLGSLNKGRARALDSAAAWGSSTANVAISMTWNTEYVCPEGYFLMSFSTSLTPKLLPDITELHCNRPTNLITSYTSIVKNNSNPWASGTNLAFSCPTQSYLIGFGVRSSDIGGKEMDVADLTLICAIPLNSLCSTNSLLSTNTTVNAPCNYQYCVANISCLPGFQSVSGSQFVECTTSGWNTSALTCVAAGICASACPPYSTCTDLLGDYSCDCNRGYVLNNSLCVNVNECLNPCLIGEVDPVNAQCNNCLDVGLVCQDLPGNFQCVNLTANECQTRCNATNTANCHNCSLIATCTDSPTSFFCTCPSGYNTSDAGVTCVDYNECLSSPCDANSNCVNSNGSYSCPCNPGYVRSGTCVNIDECQNVSACPGVANVCVDTIGSFFCLPAVRSIMYGSLPAPFTLSSTMQSPADVVQVTIQNPQNCSYNATVFYGSVGVPQDFSTTCTTVSSNATTTVLSCPMAPGAGANLTMSLRCCAGAVCGYSPPSPLMFSYPRPTLTPSTLTYANSTDPAGQARISGNQTSAILTMNGANFLPLETSVYFGPSQLPCAPLLVTYSQIICSPAVNANGTNLAFTVVVGTGGSEQSSLPGTDLLSFTGDPPLITAIVGACQPRPVGIGLMNCPTYGASTSITVSGKTLKNNLLTSPKLMVGGSLCLPSGSFASPFSNFTCVLPPGTGLDVTVEIRDVSGSSFANIISYSRPQITAISSSVCTPTSSNLTLSGCPESGFTLSIFGDNFGDSGALVQVNTWVFPATHVSSFAGEPPGSDGKHKHLFVDIPSTATLTNNVLYVLQHNGAQSSENATFALTPCAVGSGRNAIASCVPCDAGRMGVAEVCVDCLPGWFQSQAAQTACTQCPAGQAQPNSGQSSCPSCAAGSYSVGAANTMCTQCAAGRFSRASASTSCTSCPAGTLSGPNAPVCDDCLPGYFSLGNAVECQTCPPGRVSQANGSSTCAPCPFGSFKTIVGSAVCTTCPSGSYSEIQGSSACVACQPGTAQPQSRQPCTRCLAGTYQSDSGASVCPPCAAGYFSDEAGSTACDACDGGRYSNSGSSSCAPCDVGYEQPLSGSSTCSPCSPGYYSASPATRTCAACAAGYFQSSFGNSTCLFCQPGGFAPAQGSIICQQCSPGYFQPAVGQQRCIPCAAGSASSVLGSASCVDCEPGSAASQSASLSCDLCLPGQYNDQPNALICLSCPPGHISSRSGSIACPKCPATATPNEVATGCLCGLGQYTENFNGSLACMTCPRGSYCGILGLTSEDLVSIAGWWRSSNTSLNFYRCKTPRFCLANDQCVEFREGPMCALCIPGYRSGGSTKACAACPTKSAAWGLSVVIILALLVLLCVMYYVVIRLSNAQQARLLALVEEGNKIALTNLNNMTAVDDTHFEEMRRENRSMTGEPDFEDDETETEVKEIKQKLTAADTSRRSPNFMYKVKILIGFFQIASFLPSQGDVSWPSAFADFIEVFSIFTFDFVPWQTLGCAATFGYFTKAVIVGLIPLAVILLLVIYFAATVYISDLSSLQDQMLKQQRRLTIWRQFVRLVLFTVFLLYPFVSKITLGVYNCVTLEGQSYLVADFTLSCYDSTWHGYAVGIGFFVALYPIGIPIAYILIMRSVRNEMGEPGTIVMLGFLYEAYTTEAWYWELVDMLHKLFLTSVVVFVASQARMACNMAIIVVYLIGLLLVSPYVRKGDDRFHQLVQVNLYCLALCGHILNSTDDPYNTTLTDPVTLDRLLSALLICITLVLMIGFLVMTSRNVRKIYVARKLAIKKAQATVATSTDATPTTLEPASSQLTSLSPSRT